MKVKDERGLGKQLKRVLPGSLFRTMTVIFNRIMQFIPIGIKYTIGTYLRRRRTPYKLLHPTDLVVQIGAARDILHAGRCRALYFARFVRKGHVIVVEADHANCQALGEVVNKCNISNMTVVEVGAWDSKNELAFLSSRNHPAANLVAELKAIPENVFHDRKYEVRTIRVDTLDSILEGLKAEVPRLVSITTNGAELRILSGMKETIAKKCMYVSLAATEPGFDAYHDYMAKLGYNYIARDDRGYCFKLVEPPCS
jgi:FkbM family methyltransferase